MIRLTRGDGYADRIRAYKIFIDGVYRGDIKSNETKEFLVDGGKHVIYAKIDWCGSDKLYFKSDGSVMEFEVGSSINCENITDTLKLLLYITFFRNEYLWIRKMYSDR